MTERIAPYILAGGKSSRMGRDKAMIVLGGKTLLARAVETARSVPLLKLPEAKTTVTVIGDRTLLEGADRSISDRYPGCGPLGGMEAALNDLEETCTADFALFLPVDMPFLPAELIDALLSVWIVATRRGARTCHVVVDGRPQPLVSLVHRELHPFLLKALQRREFRVTPVLRDACAALALEDTGRLVSSRRFVWQTVFESYRLSGIDKAWVATEMQGRMRHLWFANLNTPDDLSEAETLFGELGSTAKQAIVPN